MEGFFLIVVLVFIGLGAWGAYLLNKSMDHRREEYRGFSKQWFPITHMGAFYMSKYFTDEGNKFRRRGNWALHTAAAVLVVGIVVTELYRNG